MFLQYLLACIALGAFHSQAKVVNSFKECKEFFYNDKEPQGMDTKAKKICQMINEYNFEFATLYSVDHRIPLYSAYTFDYSCKSDERQTCSKWDIEPQVTT